MTGPGSPGCKGAHAPQKPRHEPLAGFRNRDIRQILCPAPAKGQRQAKCSAAVTRKLLLLRAHGLIRKIPKSHRYQLTDTGRKVIAALLAARQADTAKLTKAA